MTILNEGNIQIKFPSTASVKKFDDARHGLSHCMKSVDFLVELGDKFLFIEFKDPDNPKCKKEEREKFINNFLTGSIDKDLTYKYRDSFLYQYASARTNKPIYYYVLVAIESLTEPELLVRTDALKRQLPTDGPPSGVWTQKIVAGCAVFNISTWNKFLKNYPVSRSTR